MFDSHIRNFNANILALRDFVDLIEPILHENSKEHQAKITPLVMKGMIDNLLEETDGMKEDQIEELRKSKEEYENQIVEIFNAAIEVEIDPSKVTFTGEKLMTADLRIKNSSDLDIQTYFDNAQKSKEHIDLLYNNSLLSLLSSVEWFFSQILHYFYSRTESGAGISKKTLTFTEIKELGSIEEAEKYLIDLKIEEILRSSFENWTDVLKSELKLSMGYLKNVKNSLIEVYQRRNLYVHNGGIVNSIYLSKVDKSLTDGIQRGVKLEISKEYLDDSICKLHLAFILIASELWKKLSPEDSDRGDVLTEIAFENLMESRWDIAEGISFFVMQDSKMEPIDKAVAQVNYWLCKKRTGKYAEVKDEIDKADFSDKKNIFQLALHALREEVDAFFIILPQTLDAKQLNIERLESFPIFKEMRETEEYATFKQNSSYFKEANKKVDKLTNPDGDD